MSNFVIIEKDQFETYLPDGFQPIETNAKEYVYQGTTDTVNVGIRIFSSVDIRTNKTRDLGTDAVRLVYWDILNDRPLGKGRKINRVESKTTIGDRINHRIKSFMLNAYNQTVIDLGYIKAVLNSDAVNRQQFAKSLLESLEKYDNLTEKQLAYVLGDQNPYGKPTFEATAKKYDPDFVEKYIDSLVEDADDKNIEQFEVADQEEDNEAKKEGPIENVDINNNISTKDYKPHQYPFENFNPVQSTVLPKVKEDHNMIIGANTSAGKTIAAELIMDHIIKNEIVIYLSPLKSLTQEKYEDWKKRFPDQEITILTGDYTLNEETKGKLARSNIVVMTSEMADSRTRRMKSEKNYWLLNVGLVIVDESHILTTSRGHAVETGIMRFTALNPKARILFLSATMPNVDQLGEWLSMLNGKETDVIYSTWRPVELQMNYVEYIPAINSRGREDYWETQNRKRIKAIEIALSKPDEKFLIFCHDKGTGRNIVKMLKEENVKSVFHNADLNLKDRLEIESSFKNKDGGLRILVSTSTTAWGLNLPARNVIIVGVHRGISSVDELDIIQMSGRAGRYGIDDAGFVYLVIPERSAERWKQTFLNPRPVNSVLNNRSILAFHVLAEIENRVITNVGDLTGWYKRSLANRQNLTPFDRVDAEGLVDDLLAMEMLTGDYMRLSITGLGKVSAWLYFSPYNVYAWYKNFGRIFEDPLQRQTREAANPDYHQNRSTLVELTDETLAWAIADIPSNDLGYIRKDLQDECNDWKWTLRNRGVIPTNALPSVIGAFHCLANIDDNKFSPFKRATIYDIDRQCQALALIDGMHAKWNKEKLWKTLPLRIKYGISEELIGLVRIPGIGGVRAKKLWDAGFRTIADVANPERKNRMKTILKINVNQIQSAAKKLLG